MVEKKWHVYLDTTDDDVPFYVGKGVDKRIKDLIRNQKHVNVKNKYGLKRIVLVSTCDEKYALDLETQFIKEYHTFVDDPEANRWACNLTMGGEGATPSKETRLKLSEANKEFYKDPDERKKKSEEMKNVCLKPEVKIHKSEAGKKRYENPEERKKASDRAKEILARLDVSLKISEVGKKRFKDPEERKKASDRAKNQWADPEKRRKIINAQRKRNK